MARPTVVASRAITGHSDSGMPRTIAVALAAYGAANSDTNSHRPGSAKPSISSCASARNRGTSGVTSRGENAGFISRRSRRWSSPSLFSTQLRNQRTNGPPVTPLCAGQAKLP